MVLHDPFRRGLGRWGTLRRPNSRATLLDPEMRICGRSGKFSWKRKLEAVIGYHFHFGHLYRMSKLENGAISKKYKPKSECLIDIRLQKKFLKACGSLRSGHPPPLSNF